jgi:hypothetical protein
MSATPSWAGRTNGKQWKGGLVNLNGYDAEDPHRQILSGTSARTASMSTLPAAEAQLIGFYCPVCGYLRSAEGCLPDPVPICAGSTARTGKQHEPAQAEALFIR